MVYTCGVSFSGRSYDALKEMERRCPDMSRSEIIGRCLLLVLDVLDTDTNGDSMSIFRAIENSPRVAGGARDGETATV